MRILNKQFIEEAEKVKTVPDLRPGDIIELRMQRPNKRRLSLFKGIIIAKHKAGVHTTIRVRRIIAGVGVEITFPVPIGFSLSSSPPDFSKSPPFVDLSILLAISFWKARFGIRSRQKVVAMGGSGTLISVYPEELTFLFELEKPCYCNLKVVNNSEHHVAFKVKTTSPRKYFVRPNASIVQPWDSCTITITLQAQKDYPPDMQCKDKFLIQSTKVAASTDMDEIPPDTFNKEADKVIEEMKLKVVYTLPSCGGSDDSSVSSLGSRSFKAASDDLMMLKNASLEEIQTIQRLKEERDNVLQQNQQMQRELDVLRRRRSRKGDAGFSLTFAAFAGLIGLMVGLLMSLIFSSAPADAYVFQEECLQRLQNRIEVQYDSANREHQKSFQELLRKQNGDRAIWEYPFAVAGVNITFMLIQMLDLQSVKPRSLFGAVFLKLLSENDQAFDILYCITFKLMDQQWLDMHATYMDFNTVMKSTRRQLERELLIEDIQRIEDMPSYRLLAR
ncbi:Vesicle-associated protein 2-1 [Zea mays]|uniref:Vesicle-associated protein 2-1 n=1 Tax=Zea mays TaxID=4577 RepID=A0A3L6EIF2_MAIZE|nr:Vesicle-associated protein 2-1 [Zea mays]